MDNTWLKAETAGTLASTARRQQADNQRFSAWRHPVPCRLTQGLKRKKWLTLCTGNPLPHPKWRFALWGNKAKETVNVGYKLCSHGAQLSKWKSAFKMNKASPGPHPDQPGHRLPRLMPDAEDQRTPLRLWFSKCGPPMARGWKDYRTVPIFVTLWRLSFSS